MIFQLRRSLLTLSMVLLFYVYLCESMETTTMANSEEDDSSSEETAEDSDEARRKRSAELMDNSDGDNNNNNDSPKAAIPGLPDPAVILEIAEILQSVGEKVIPILVQGNPATTLVSDRFGQQFQFVSKLKKQIEQFDDSQKGPQNFLGNWLKHAFV